MVRAAAYRFLVLLLGSSVVITLLAAAFGALDGLSLDRAVSLGFYLAGAVVLAIGFFAGNRGPARARDSTGLPGMLPTRITRWATRDEQQEAINESAVLVVLGISLVLLGVVIDSRYSLF